jgi:microcystin-dependent protein
MTNVAVLQTTADLAASQISAASSLLVPSGTVFSFAGSSAPTGWLLCNGAAVSRTTYAGLFAVIGTTFGSGDGSTTFNVPNTSGIFISGTGSQTISSITYTRTHGATQGDLMQGHYHTNPSSYARGTFSPSGSTAAYSNPDGSAVAWPNPQNPTSDGTNGTPRTGAETRPANLALNHIIKT